MEVLSKRAQMEVKGKYLLMSVIFVVSVFVAGCRNKEIVLDTTDPLTQSFWGRHIKTMTRRFCLDSTCSTFDSMLVDVSQFDSAGNIISERDSFSERRMSYDKHHFMIRDWNRTDVLQNIVISYEYNEKLNCVFKYTTELLHTKWLFTKSDLDSGVMDTTKLQLDALKRIVAEKDMHDKVRVRYSYDGALLSKKITYSFGKINQEIDYIYDGLILREINVMEEVNSVAFKYFFTDQGLLTYSTRRIFGSPEQFSRYQFEFY